MVGIKKVWSEDEDSILKIRVAKYPNNLAKACIESANVIGDVSAWQVWVRLTTDFDIKDSSLTRHRYTINDDKVIRDAITKYGSGNLTYALFIAAAELELPFLSIRNRWLRVVSKDDTKKGKLFFIFGRKKRTTTNRKNTNPNTDIKCAGYWTKILKILGIK